jgi:hypothetical protein
MFGLFAAFVFYLWKFVPADPTSNITQPTADIISDTHRSTNLTSTNKEVDEIQWDFYEIFPKSEVPIVEEFSPAGERIIVPENYRYALQIGSFRNPDDADRLRAKLILTGLKVYIQEFDQHEIKWHRVLVGPIGSKLEMNRIRERLASENIETIQLRMNQ